MNSVTPRVPESERYIADAAQFETRAKVRARRKRWPLVIPLRWLCRFRRLRSWAIGRICRVQGGQLWSTTFRELMWKYYGVSIGIHSYGSSFGPNGLPRGTVIGNYCSVGTNLRVFRRGHTSTWFSQHPFFYAASVALLERDMIADGAENPLTIEHDVWIGCNAIVVPGCRKIGTGAIVGAGSVVTRDVEPFTVVAGNPARKIGERFTPEIRAVVLESRWWLVSPELLARELELFHANATLESACRLRDFVHKILHSAPPDEIDKGPAPWKPMGSRAREMETVR